MNPNLNDRYKYGTNSNGNPPMRSRLFFSSFGFVDGGKLENSLSPSTSSSPVELLKGDLVLVGGLWFSLGGLSLLGKPDLGSWCGPA